MRPLTIFFLNVLRCGRKGTPHQAGNDLRIASSGFTLVELMIVIAILGTLAGIALPSLTAYVDSVKYKKVVIELHILEKEINNFYNSNGRYPNDLTEIGLSSMKDAWGNQYCYLPVAGTPKGKLRKDHFMVPVNSDYDLYSMGKDGKTVAPFTAKASRDDIVRANDGQYFGRVSDY